MNEEKTILCKCKLGGLEDAVCVELPESAYNAISKALETSPGFGSFRSLGRPYGAEETERVRALWEEDTGYPDGGACAICGKALDLTAVNNPYPLFADDPAAMLCGDCNRAHAIPARVDIWEAVGADE